MKQSTKWLTLLVPATAVLALVTVTSRTNVVPKAHADDDDGDGGGCTRAAVSGVYAASFRGFVGTHLARRPVAAAGFVQLDTQGVISGKDTLSKGGAITPRIITGTYTIGRDQDTGACRGTATTSVGNFSFATTGEDRITGALFVSTVPGTTIEGRTIRQGSAGDDDD